MFILSFKFNYRKVFLIILVMIIAVILGVSFIVSTRKLVFLIHWIGAVYIILII